MQLIKITTTPIEYRIQIDPARLEMKTADNPQVLTKSRGAKLHPRTKNIQIRMDSTEMRNSIGIKSAPVLLREAAENGKQAAMRATAEYAQFANQIGMISKGVRVSDIITQKVLAQPTMRTVFLPTTGPHISWDLNSIETEYEPGELQTDWQVHRNMMEYVPGKFQLNILQYPKVHIEYLGGPNYVPPSAAPDYEE